MKGKQGLTRCLIYETSVGEIHILKQCEKEINDFPEVIRGEFADALARLGMPLSRPMPSIYPGAHELRFRDRAGIYRVIYYIKKTNCIWLVHAFKKKTQNMPLININLAKQRIRGLK